ncbi:hypothetical protein PTTG_30272, partial [Puccinia triticina 1-1 BBBD Race 1]
MTLIRGIPWGSNGHEGGPSSMMVLIDWLATNYERWHVLDTQASKPAIACKVIDDLALNGIHNRKVSEICLWIFYLERSYSEAAEFRRRAGGSQWGIDPLGRRVCVQAHTRRICSHWDRYGTPTVLGSR